MLSWVFNLILDGVVREINASTGNAGVKINSDDVKCDFVQTIRCLIYIRREVEHYYACKL